MLEEFHTDLCHMTSQSNALCQTDICAHMSHIWVLLVCSLIPRHSKFLAWYPLTIKLQVDKLAKWGSKKMQKKTRVS